jgi:hypothetical protein
MIINDTGTSTSYLGHLPYSSYRQQLASFAQTADDFTALSHLPIQAYEPVSSRSTMWATFPNLRTLGYGLPAVTQDAIVLMNIAKCNLDRTNIDPNK